MARTVVGIFDNETEARDAMQHLQQEGISRSNIDLALPHQAGNRDAMRTDSSQQRTNSNQNQHWTSDENRATQNPDFNRSSSETMGTQQNQGWNQNAGADRDTNRNQEDEGLFSRIGNFFSSLFDNDDDAQRYTQASQHRTIVTVHAATMDEAETAADIMDECGAIDTDNQTNYDHATGNMSQGSSFGESNMNTGSRSRMNSASRRSRIFERPIAAENRLFSDQRDEDIEDYNPLNRKPLL